MILCDRQIRELVTISDMISPFEDKLVRCDESGWPVISYGLSSYGYDIRVAPEWYTLRRNTGHILDAKTWQPMMWNDTIDSSIVIEPHGFVLARSIEYMKIPDHVMCIVCGKSTYARLGLIVNVTPLEPGWEGHITLELTNSTPVPVRVYGNEGIAQVIFHEGQTPDVTYASRNGKYQKQTGITIARI